MGLHHKLCHTLGGSFGLPHAEAHTVVLPHALAYNAAAAPRGDGAHRPGARRGRGDAARGRAAAWRARARRAHVLAAIGMPADGLDRAADLAVPDPLPQPARRWTAPRCVRCCSAPTTAPRREPEP